MITLVVTILLIIAFLVLTRKQRSEYYEEDIGPSDIEMGPSEDVPVRPRSLVHKIKQGVKKTEEKRTQDVILHDLFLKQVDMKAAKKQGTQDEIKAEIQDSIDEELKFMKKYTKLVEDHMYENKTLPEDKTYDIVAESAHDALRNDINNQLVVKGKEYRKKQDKELALQTEQREKLDREVSDTRIVKKDLGDGLETLKEVEPQITAEADAIDDDKMPTTNLGQDALMSRSGQAIMGSTPYTQKMASIFASASLAPDGGWNDGQVEDTDVDASDIKTPKPPEDKHEKIIQFSEVGNVFEDYYAIQDPNGYWSEHGHKPIDPDTGKWRKEKVQMKISCGPDFGHVYDPELGDSSEWENSEKVKFNLFAAALGHEQQPRKPFEGPGGRRRDSRYAKHFYSRPFDTWGGGGLVLDDKGDACLPPPGGGGSMAWLGTFQECADACKNNDKCSAFSIDPIFDSETGGYSRSLSEDEGAPFMSLTAGPDKIGGTPNKFKNKYWCKLQKYGARRFDIATFSGETIFAKYEDGYLKDPLIKEHISKKIDANTSDIAGQGDFAHPKFPRTCDESPLRSEVSKYESYSGSGFRWYTGEQSRSGRDHSRASGLGIYRRSEDKYAISDKHRSELPKSILDTYALPADSARFTNASWVYPDVDGACKNGGKNELTMYPGKFRADDEADPNTQIQIGCPIQFIGTSKHDLHHWSPRMYELVEGGWLKKIVPNYYYKEAKPNPINLGWVNHGVEPGSNIVRNKIKMGSDGRYNEWLNIGKNRRTGEYVDENTMIDDDYRSLVLPGKTAIPACPDGYAVRTENQPYCDPDTLKLSTPFAKCEPILERGGCVAKESKHQNVCSSLTEHKCLTTPIDGDQLGMPKLDTQTSLSKLQGGLFSDGREYGDWSELEQITNPFWTQSIHGKMSSELCEWKSHTFYDGKVSRTAVYDGKQFWILRKRGQLGAWTVGQPSYLDIEEQPKWNWNAGGYDPKFNEWAKFFDDKGKIVLKNIDGTVNQEAVKYQAAVLEKMGGGFKPTEIPVVYFKMDKDTGGPLAKDLAEKAALGFFGDDVE